MKILVALLAFVSALSPASAGPALLEEGGGAHEAAAREIWRVVGHLETPEGRRFGVAVTFFRYAIAGREREAAESRWRATDFYPAAFSLADESAGRALSTTRMERATLGLAGAATGRLDVHVDDWSIAQAGRAIRLHVTNGDVALDLIQIPVKPALALAPGTYAYPRLRASGTLRLDGKSFALAGWTWLDHEFGPQRPAGGAIGHDRFTIQFDDGRELFVQAVRRRDGSLAPGSYGAVIAKNGRVERLTANDFQLEVQQPHWTSPHTAANYPSLWELWVPKAGLDLAVVPPLLDQEISEPDGPSFYEATVDVERAPPPGGDRGRGYVELTGYGT